MEFTSRGSNPNPFAKSGNPVGDSPSDSSTKRFISKKGFNAFKENVRKGIQAGTKGFMAPTISAMYKYKKSPSLSIRKKVLSERNETVGSSIQEGGKPGSKSEIGFDFTHKNPLFEPRDLDYETVDITEPISTQLLPLKFTEETAALVLPEPKTIPIGSAEKTTNPPPSSSSPYHPASIGSADKTTSNSPLDSDCHLPPYDPKTNYLSPRPRFLYYKPRPRIEVYVQNEKEVDFVEEGKKLEESFSSTSCSDTENTDEAPSSGSGKEEGSEDDYPSEFVCEPILNYKTRSFIGSRIKIALLLMVGIIFLPFQVTNTPLLWGIGRDAQEHLGRHMISEPVDTDVMPPSSDLEDHIPSQSAELEVTTDTSELNNGLSQSLELVLSGAVEGVETLDKTTVFPHFGSLFLHKLLESCYLWLQWLRRLPPVYLYLKGKKDTILKKPSEVSSSFKR